MTPRLPDRVIVDLAQYPCTRRMPAVDPGAESTSLRALAYRPPVVMCACFDTCRCEVVNGRTLTGAHCKAHLQDGLE